MAIFLYTAMGIPGARAQAQFSGWLGTFQNYSLSKKTGLYFDGQFRSADQLHEMHALLLRGGFNFIPVPNLTATAGYAYILQQRTASGVSGYLPEHRSWEQLAYGLQVNGRNDRRPTNVIFRLRLEQRYLPVGRKDGNALVRSGHAYANRLRYFNRAVIPMGGKRLNTRSSNNGRSGQAFTGGFFIALQNEIFFNPGDASAVNNKFFDQNRAYAALGYRVSPQFDLEMGYLNQYISGAGRKSSVNHVTQIATYLRL